MIVNYQQIADIYNEGRAKSQRITAEIVRLTLASPSESHPVSVEIMGIAQRLGARPVESGAMEPVSGEQQPGTANRINQLALPYLLRIARIWAYYGRTMICVEGQRVVVSQDLPPEWAMAVEEIRQECELEAALLLVEEGIPHQQSVRNMSQGGKRGE